MVAVLLVDKKLNLLNHCNLRITNVNIYPTQINLVAIFPTTRKPGTAIKLLIKTQDFTPATTSRERLMNQIRTAPARAPGSSPAFLKKALATAILGTVLFAPAAQADIITFEGLATGGIGNGDVLLTQGYQLTSFSNDSAADLGSLSGAIFDGTDTGVCSDGGLACPVNNRSNYYAGLADGSVFLANAGVASGGKVRLSGFDASFIGAGGPYPLIAGLLQVWGFKADNTAMMLEYALGGPGTNGFEMMHRSVDAEFAATDFVQLAFYGYACDAQLNCSDIDTLKAQFALDNVDVTAVPEPSTAAVMLLGLAGIAAMTSFRSRRRAKDSANSYAL